MTFIKPHSGLQVGNRALRSVTALIQSDIPKPRSFERERPKPSQAQTQPRSPLRESYKAGRRRPAAHSPPMEDDYDRRGDRHPPFAPEVPLSPTFSTSATASSTQSSKASRTSKASSLPDHWLPLVCEQSQPTTPLETTGQTLVVQLHRH